MEIKATAHIKEDKTEVRIEVWDQDYTGEGTGLPEELKNTLIARGYEDTDNNITGLRLTIPAAKGRDEMVWLKTNNIPMTQGNFYK